MKNIDEIADTIDVLKKGIKNQLESATVTLQLVYQSDDCPENISKILYRRWAS